MTQAQKILLARNTQMARMGRSARYALVTDKNGNEIVVKVGSPKYQRYSLGCPVRDSGDFFQNTSRGIGEDMTLQAFNNSEEFKQELVALAIQHRKQDQCIQEAH